LYFEPDVAADPSDRGENRDPGAATEESKRLLTRETRLENDHTTYAICESRTVKVSASFVRKPGIENWLASINP